MNLNMIATMIGGRFIPSTAVAFSLLLSTSCSILKTDRHDYISGDWNIVSVNGKEVEATDTERQPFIHFDKPKGKISGNTGCNYLMGKCWFDNKNGRVTFSNLGSTMMACPDMTTETAILEALRKVISYSRTRDGSIEFHDSDGKIVLTLAPAPK